MVMSPSFAWCPSTCKRCQPRTIFWLLAWIHDWHWYWHCWYFSEHFDEIQLVTAAAVALWKITFFSASFLMVLNNMYGISGISEVAFYGLLKDPVFVDYFNVFLSLPVRQLCLYYGLFITVSIINFICKIIHYQQKLFIVLSFPRSTRITINVAKSWGCPTILGHPLGQILGCPDTRTPPGSPPLNILRNWKAFIECYLYQGRPYCAHTG